LATAHSHGNAPPHEHEGATPGHTHEAGDTTGTATTTPVAPAGTAAAGTAAAEHSHAGTGSHTHADAPPGHTHDALPAAVDVRPTAGGLITRILLTVLGAAGMIIGAFLDWFSFDAAEVPPGTDLAGTKTSWSVFYSTDEPFGADLIESAGAVAILLGILALLGLVFRTGWLTTLAGVLGLVAFALVVITLFRVPEADFGIADVGIGLWVVLAGSILAILGGFFGARPRAVARTGDTTARF
jgi:hypothetical protein